MRSLNWLADMFRIDISANTYYLSFNTKHGDFVPENHSYK